MREDTHHKIGECVYDMCNVSKYINCSEYNSGLVCRIIKDSYKSIWRKRIVEHSGRAKKPKRLYRRAYPIADYRVRICVFINHDGNWKLNQNEIIPHMNQLGCNEIKSRNLKCWRKLEQLDLSYFWWFSISGKFSDDIHQAAEINQVWFNSSQRGMFIYLYAHASCTQADT